jgi:hypothetical protein
MMDILDIMAEEKIENDPTPAGWEAVKEVVDSDFQTLNEDRTGVENYLNSIDDGLKNLEEREKEGSPRKWTLV